MNFDNSVVRKCLKSFDFKTLFLEHLGWDKHKATLDIPIDGTTITLTALAQKRGFVAWLCPSIPERSARLSIDHKVTKSSREHFVIYADGANDQQVWQWVRREQGKPLASREHRFDTSQTGDALIQRLNQIAVSLHEEEALTVVDVAGKARAAFDVDKVTKKFFDRFKTEHAAFRKLVSGITGDAGLEWYTSLMLNRLMFVYFIQKKGFLAGDRDYLQNRLKQIRLSRGKDKFQSFYRYFLVRLFHDGLGKPPADRRLEPKLAELLGDVPYLNGGYFEVHKLEEANLDIDIPDKAFEKLFNFLDEYSWHLDERPLRADNEINPDVLGFIFEKYINQKQMGAYYTKEDITEYISKNTIIPFLFDAAEKQCAVAFAPESALWRLLSADPDRYIYDAVRHGVIDAAGNVLSLPKEIAAGIGDIAKRGGWNKAASDPFALPTETWREHVARRQRCLELRTKLRNGEVHQINDLITRNLNIWQFARDAISHAEGPELLRAFWDAIGKVTVLDPTCGSGAFLFAALRILETLYSDCVTSMRGFVQDSNLPMFKTIEDELQALIKEGENSIVEFKSSARWDYRRSEHNQELEDAIVKAVAGYLNTDGGTLVIGVDDSGTAVGLAKDYEITKAQKPNRDQFELWLQQYLKNKLGLEDPLPFRIDFTLIDGHDVCRVVAGKSFKPIVVTKNGRECFYVRRGNATPPLEKQSEIAAYVKAHWQSDSPPTTSRHWTAPAATSGSLSIKAKPTFHDFRSVLEQIAKHPNERYFILKSIIIGNLFGVDIMREAVEICKLRLFLKLVAQVETVGEIEPLPDIDFNIRAGNTLVGFASLDQVRKSQGGRLGFAEKEIRRIEEDAEIVNKAFKQFRAQQTTYGGIVTPKDKFELHRRLTKLSDQLDLYLAGEYGIDVDKTKKFAEWKESHDPFHWFVEFFGIMSGGGFDVIVGNPPYVEYSKIRPIYQVRGYAAIDAGNLYAFVMERNALLSRRGARSGMIVPHSAFCTDRMAPLQSLFVGTSSNLWLSTFCIRPAKLFTGVDQRLCIYLTSDPGQDGTINASRYNRWNEEQRPHLMSLLQYSAADGFRYPNSVPKLGDSTAHAVWDKVKCLSGGNLAGAAKSGGKCFFHNAPRYWVRVMTFVPYFWNERDGEQISSHVKPLMSQAANAVAVASLNSGLFYWWFIVLSNCRDLTNREIENFPLDLDRMRDGLRQELEVLTKSLMADFKHNKVRKTCQYKATGEVVYDEFYPRHSKPIIDEIDRVLAKHYGFTAEELDYIINYDIKYRMGGAVDEDDGEE